MSNLSGLWGNSTQEEMAKEARGDFEILPPGWYSATITKAELSDTQSGGKMVVVTLLTGNGVEIRDYINIKNDSEKAQAIGRQRLAKLACEAGVKNLTDTMQLNGLPVDVKLKVEKFKSNTTGNELESNKVADYKKSDASNESNNSGGNKNAPW